MMSGEEKKKKMLQFTEQLRSFVISPGIHSESSFAICNLQKNDITTSVMVKASRAVMCYRV